MISMLFNALMTEKENGRDVAYVSTNLNIFILLIFKTVLLDRNFACD